MKRTSDIKRTSHKENLSRFTDEYSDEIAKRKRRRGIIIAIAIIILPMIFYLLFLKHNYSIREAFAWSIEERDAARGLHFAIVEREQPKEAAWYEEVLHMDWYDNVVDEYIDAEILSLYQRNTNIIFSVLPEKENRISENDDVDTVFTEKKNNFEALVKSNHANLHSEELWKGYEDGIEVCKVYDTSENVFQTGVLAESACENAYKSQQSPEAYLIYTAGMVGQFEKFLGFHYRDAGKGVEISEAEVCFRIEKGLYRVSREYRNRDGRIARHCGLFAYSCSQYCIDRISIDDECYLMYLYNSCLNCLNILQYIDDEELCSELCQKELSRWEQLEGKDMSGYKTEGKTLDEIIDIKGRLEEYVVF